MLSLAGSRASHLYVVMVYNMSCHRQCSLYKVFEGFYVRVFCIFFVSWLPKGVCYILQPLLGGNRLQMDHSQVKYNDCKMKLG